MLMDPYNYIKIAIVLGSITFIIILISSCIVYRRQIFQCLCREQTAVVENIIEI